MNESTENLIKIITRQVLEQLNYSESIPKMGKKRILVIGPICEVPEEFRNDSYLLTNEDCYECCECVLITKLTMTQLSDIALGRDASFESSAVCNALLNGTDVFILETALPHRKFDGSRGGKLYSLLDGYANTLEEFGVKLIKVGCQKNDAEVCTEKPCIPSLITEKDAVELSKNRMRLIVPNKTVITPSAKDVFHYAGVEVTVEGGKK